MRLNRAFPATTYHEYETQQTGAAASDNGKSLTLDDDSLLYGQNVVLVGSRLLPR